MAQPFDYNTIADVYDEHRRAGGPFMPALARLADEANAARVLELGCGTGNSAQAFLTEHPCELTGVDRAPNMLQHAARKSICARWVNADASRLPFASASVDFAFGVLMLHLNRDIAPVLGECARVLRPGGRVAFVTAPHGFIRNHVLNEFFPSFAAIDLERFQSEEAIGEAMCDAGFTNVQTELTKRDPQPIDADYVEKIAGYFITTLRLIPEDEFAAGLARLRKVVAEKGQLDRPMVWEAVVVSAERSA